MKIKRNNKIPLLSSKPKASQRRHSLQRLREELLARNVRVLLSPLPPSYLSPRSKDEIIARNVQVVLSPLRHYSPRKSITNRPRSSIVLVDRRSGAHVATIDASRLTTASPRLISVKKRKITRRKNEAERLQEELLKKNTSMETDIFSSRRALRSRTISTPKSPRVRTKNAVRKQIPKSRRISSSSLNKYKSRDFRIVIEKLPIEESLSLARNIQSTRTIDEPIVGEKKRETMPPKIHQTREFKILLERLPPTYEPLATTKETPGSSSSVPSYSEESSEDVASDEADDVTEALRSRLLRDVRILIPRIPDTWECATSSGSSLEHMETQPVDVEDDDNDTEINNLPVDTTIVSEAANGIAKDDTISTRSSPLAILESPSTSPTPVVSEPLSPQPSTSTSTATSKSNVEAGDEHALANVSPPSTPVNSSAPNTTSKVTEKTPISQTVSPTSSTPPATPDNTAKITTSPLATPISPLAAGTSPSSAKKTPKPLAIPLRQVTIVKSKFTKLKSSPINTSTLSLSVSRSFITSLFSPASSKSIGSDTQRSITTPKTPSRSVASLSRDSSSAQTRNPIIPAPEPSTSYATRPSTSGVTSSPSYGILSPILKPQSHADALRSASSTSKHSSSGPVYVHKSPLTPAKWTYPRVSDAATSTSSSKPILLKKILKATSATVVPSTKPNQISEISSQPSSHSAATDSNQSSTQRCISKESQPTSPDVAPLTPVTPPQSEATLDANQKTPTASPFSRGRLMAQQSQQSSPIPPGSLAESPKPQSTQTTSASELRRSKSTGSPFNRGRTITQHCLGSSPSTVSMQITYQQKWSSAGDLLKASNEQKLQTESQLSSDQSSTPSIDLPPTKGVFSNDKTFSAVLSTLKIDDKAESKKSPWQRFTESLKKPTKSPYVARSLQMPPKTSKPDDKSTPIRSVQPTQTKSACELPSYASNSQPTFLKPAPPRTPTTPTASTKQPHSLFRIPKAKPLNTTSSTPKTKSSSVITSPAQTSLFKSSSTSNHTRHPSITQHSAIKSSSNTSGVPASASTSPTLKPPSDLPKPHYVSFSHMPTKPSYTQKNPPHHHRSTSLKNHRHHFKTTYMTSRSSNASTFEKYLPSGPQYSPSYSKYLSKGFSQAPNIQYKPSKPSKPSTAAKSDVLHRSTMKPWLLQKPSTPPTGPSNSLTSSVVTSDPAYSPLCPQYAANNANY